MLRFKIWLAVKCMKLANWVLKTRPDLARAAKVEPTTDEELQAFHRELLNYTGDVRH